MRTAVRTLLEGLIDYAGLFPPAKLSMGDAVAEFARRKNGEDAVFLGKFICPASRLDELTEQGQPLMPGTWATSGYREMALDSEPWEISAVIDQPLEEALDAIDAFNQRHDAEDKGLARVRTIEMKIAESGDIDDAMEALPEDLQPFFEIPRDVLDGDPRGMIAALATAEGLAGKIRCGGVEPHMIPSTESVARFIATCARANVPFKATAGLHHPIRAEQPLTYDADPPRAVMHGFVNVFVASALASCRKLDADKLVPVLEETDASAFTFNDEQAAWRDLNVGIKDLATSRARFALGYGSCSFTEPLDDLRGLGWL
ncbi:MAG: hypothetical protein AAF235_03660 [Planctomycetota bacterium]